MAKSFSTDDYQGAMIKGVTLQSPTIQGATMTGLTSAGPVRASELVVSDILASKGWPFQFEANAPYQKIDLYCQSIVAMEALLDVTVTSHSGTLSRRYSLQKQGTGVIQSGSRYIEVIGTVSQYLAIGDVEWDVNNLRWRFKIGNRTPYPTTLHGTISINLTANQLNADQLLGSFGVGSVYTTDTSAMPEPIYQFAGSIQADSLITNFTKKAVNYQVTNLDSVIIATAGITITLPATTTVGVGRSYTIKNIQNMGVTVVPTGTSLIDTATSHIVGNKKTFTYTSDGIDWWITSAFG